MVVRDMPCWLRDEEKSVGARCHRDNDNAFVNVVWQRQRGQQFKDGFWTRALDNNDGTATC